MKLPILWTLALRNLGEHRRRTLSVGSIMAFGLFLLVVGNGFLDSATQGVKASYIEKYTGDLFVAAPTRSAISVFGGAPGDNSAKLVPVGNFETVQRVLEASPDVDLWNGHAVNIAQILVGEQARGAAQLLGVDSERYLKAFPRTVKLAEGSFWNPGEPGLILNSNGLKTLREKSGQNIRVGDRLALTLLGPGGKIVEVPLTGVADIGNTQGPLGFVGWCDIDTLRLLKGYTVETDAPVAATASPTPVSEDELFSDTAVAEIPQATGIDLASLTSLGLGPRAAARPDPQAWEFVTVRLKEGVDPVMAQKALTEDLKAAGADVQVQDWVTGAGQQAQTVLALKAAFDIVILIIALVAVFIVMNALMISVSERTTEIGTMRALGGRRRLVRNMILLEVFFLSVAAGAVGLAVSWVVLGLLNLTGVPLNSFFLQMLFSSDNVKPVFSVLGSLGSWLELMVVGLIAGWYPAHTALRLSPLKAIQTD